METRHFIALGLLLIATLMGVGVTSLWPRARDLAFFLMLAGAVVTHKLDVNFLTHFWYRGTTRGLESDGALRVETAGGKMKVVRAGDVTAVRSTNG